MSAIGIVGLCSILAAAAFGALSVALSSRTAAAVCMILAVCFAGLAGYATAFAEILAYD